MDCGVELSGDQPRNETPKRGSYLVSPRGEPLPNQRENPSADSRQGRRQFEEVDAAKPSAVRNGLILPRNTEQVDRVKIPQPVCGKLRTDGQRDSTRILHLGKRRDDDPALPGSDDGVSSSLGMVDQIYHLRILVFIVESCAECYHASDQLSKIRSDGKLSEGMYDLVVRGGTVVTSLSSQTIDVAVNAESIAALGKGLRGHRTIDASGLLVFPGVIDAHTHMNLPVSGTRSSDDFYTGTVAAAFGGVTTIVDFTLGSPHTSIPLDIDRRLEDLTPAVVDVGLHAEVVGWNPNNAGQFVDACRRGVTSFKFYTTYSASGRQTPPDRLRAAMQHLGDLGCTVLVHCEDEDLIRSIMGSLPPEKMADMATLAEARPDLCEQTAISLVGRIAAQTHCRTHIVHVSSARGLAAVQEARRSGAQLTAETCPQYLVLASDSYARMDGHLFSAAPALRSLRDQNALWHGLRDRTLDWVATDHCPFRREQKAWKGRFDDLPYGLPGVETLLPLLYSEGVGRGRLSLTDIPRLLSEAPALALHLADRKGAIKVGLDADLVLFDPTVAWEISAGFLHMRTDFSPYEGWNVCGKPVVTISRGEVIMEEGEFTAQEGRGRFLFRRPLR